MDWILLILLFLHISGAILAFGPAYAFLFLGPMAAGEPEHRNFALRFQQRVATTLVVPLAVFQGVTGVLLVWRISFELFTALWLIVSIVLYLIALGIAFGVMRPRCARSSQRPPVHLPHRRPVRRLPGRPHTSSPSSVGRAWAA